MISPVVRPIKRICFDIETELFSEAFRTANDLRTRLKLIPKMRIACTFDGIQWRYFLPSEGKELVALLLAADEVISFNGKAYDELVLRKHHKLKGNFSEETVAVVLARFPPVWPSGSEPPGSSYRARRSRVDRSGPA
jgi:hypothetical protein